MHSHEHLMEQGGCAGYSHALDGGMTDYMATASAEVEGSPRQVWQVLTDNELLGEVMLGSQVFTDWEVGGPIVFRGEWKGMPFEDKGIIDELTEPRRIQMRHFSPASGLPDEPENYHHVTFELEPIENGSRTQVTIRQDGNADAEAADHSSANWQTMLGSLQEIVLQA
jgi:uncharacterized protein YndB with AHSA1/START domain